MQAVGAIQRHVDGVAVLGQALAQVLGGPLFVFDHEDFHGANSARRARHRVRGSVLDIAGS